MSISFDVSDSSYFLRIGPTRENERVKTLATGVKIFKSEDPMVAEQTWGHLSFFDQISERHRVITLPASPELNEKEFECKSDIGDLFQFSFVTKKLWDEKVAQIVNTPPEVKDRLVDTNAVQVYLKSLYP